MKVQNVLLYILSSLITLYVLEKLWFVLGTDKARNHRNMLDESDRFNLYRVLAFAFCMMGKYVQEVWLLWLVLFVAVLLVSRSYEVSSLHQKMCFGIIYLALVLMESVGWFYARNYTVMQEVLLLGIAEYLLGLLLNGVRMSGKGVKLRLFYWMMVLFVPVFSFYMVMLFLKAKGLGIGEVTLGLLAVLSINVVLIEMFNKLSAYYNDVLKKNIMERQNTYYEKQLEDLSAAYKEIRSVRHDIKNNMLVISSLLEQDKKEEVLSHVNQTMQMKGFTLDFVHTGHISIDSILNFKFHEIQEKGICLKYKLQLAETFKVNTFDMAVILGNFLDNAIEACEKEKEAFIHVMLSDNKENFKVIVENSCDKDLQVDGDVKSTKEDKLLHGIGLSNIREVIKKYNGEMFLKANQGVFSAAVLLHFD